MKSSEIVSYIKHYMNKDMCKGAIMLDLKHCNGDKVEKLQYSFFIDNLSDIIERLSN